MGAVKRGWNLYESWGTRFRWAFCSTLTRAVKRGWNLYESWVTRFRWAFCSTLTRAVKRGWNLYESWVTRFRWAFCSTLTRAVKRGWDMTKVDYMFKIDKNARESTRVHESRQECMRVDESAWELAIKWKCEFELSSTLIDTWLLVLS